MKPSPNNPPTQGLTTAFTLIELLVVIAIIAVLASISLPVIGKMRDNADSVFSIDQMRKLGTSFALVAGENNMNLPVGYGLDTTIGGTAKQNFQKRLSISPSQFGSTVQPLAYLALFQNKMATKKENYPASKTLYVGATPYGINTTITADVVNSSPSNPSLYGDQVSGTWNILKIPNPGQTAIMADTYINPAYSSADATFDPTRSYNPWNPSDPTNSGNKQFAISYRHPGVRAALLFADWHIRTVSRPELVANLALPVGSWFDPSKQ